MQQFTVVDAKVMDELEKIQKNQQRIIRQNTTIQVGGALFGMFILGGIVYLIADNRSQKKRGE
jgi:hypothetical protein